MGYYVKIEGEYKYVPSDWDRLQKENDSDGHAQWVQDQLEVTDGNQES